jgi:hypothetical protein
MRTKWTEFKTLASVLNIIPNEDRSEARRKCYKYGGFNAFWYKVENIWKWKSKELTAHAKRGWVLIPKDREAFLHFERKIS